MHSKCSASAAAAAAESLQSYLTLCNSIDHSLPGFPVPGILQARTMEWAARGLNFIWTLLILDAVPILGELFLKICPPAVRPAAEPIEQLIFLPSAFPWLPLQL